MNDQDYIRKAVELADEWGWARGTNFEAWTPWCEKASTDYPWDTRLQWIQDALAAQLVRQVDALNDYGVYSEPEQTHLWNDEQSKVDSETAEYWPASGPDRTMNTIKAIVDSGVLEKNDRRRCKNCDQPFDHEDPEHWFCSRECVVAGIGK